MPIYAYRCEACGFAKDVLQKMSDPQLTVCLSCNAPSFKKQLTAAGFQLKGTGWYATDFRNGNNKPAAASEGNQKEGRGDQESGGKPESDAASNANGNNKGTAADADKAGSSKAGIDQASSDKATQVKSASGTDTATKSAAAGASSVAPSSKT